MGFGEVQRFLVFTLVIAAITLPFQAKGQDTIRSGIPKPEGTSTSTPEIPWQPPGPDKLSEIYDYSIRSNSAIGTGNSVPNSSLGRTVNSTTQSHLLGLRVGLTEKWALRFVTAAQDNQYQMKKGNLQRTIYVQGLGDCKVQGIYSIYKDVFHRFEAYAGTTIPTGATDLTGPDGLPLNPRNQLGSGTFDFVPGISYTFTSNHWTLGNKLEATIHNGKNSSGYKLGDDFGDTTTASYEFIKIFSPEINVNIKNKQKTMNDRPLLVVKESKFQQTDPSTGQPGPSGTQPDLNRAGTSMDGTVALVSHLPFSAQSGIKASLIFGVPLFHAGSKPDTGLQTDWFAGSSVSATF